MDLLPKHELNEQLSIPNSAKSSFRGLHRNRRNTLRKISRVKQQAITEKCIKSMNEHAKNDSKKKSERVKLMKFLWKDVKSRITENLDLTLDYDVVDLRDLDPQGTLLKYAVSHNFMDVVAVLLRHNSPIVGSGEDGLSPLHLSIKMGSIPMLAMILANNPPINVEALYEHRTPLHVAVRINNTEALELLLEHGADPNNPDIYGSTPLHLAARLGRDHLIKTLIDHGANVQAIDNEGWTPMHLASDAGHTSSVRLLLQNNSIVDAQSKYGKTSLHWACEKGHLHVVQALLDKEANTLIRDSNNKLAKDYASTPLIRNLITSYTKEPAETVYIPRNNYFDCRLRNKSLIDLVDLTQFQDPYAHHLNQDMIGKGAMQDERSKPMNHRAKSMPYILESRSESEIEERSYDFKRQSHRQSSIKSSLSFASFTTVSESEIDFAMNTHCESLPVLSLDPIEEEGRIGGHYNGVHFNIGDSGISDSGTDSKPQSRTNSLEQHDRDILPIQLTNSCALPNINVDNNHNVKMKVAEADIKIENAKDSFQCKVPTAKLIETLEDMHEKVDTYVDENVHILNDVFRDVTLLRHPADDFKSEDRENAFDNIEKNIKDIVIKLKELKVQFDGQVLDI